MPKCQHNPGPNTYMKLKCQQYHSYLLTETSSISAVGLAVYSLFAFSQEQIWDGEHV